ncbi:MAG: hypothetical protein JAY64_15865, partial [Candidatus Thiodiazotropha weberae]|nr:hypothetical protein [Candidatus Thiodiazotropha lotti]
MVQSREVIFLDRLQEIDTAQALLPKRSLCDRIAIFIFRTCGCNSLTAGTTQYCLSHVKKPVKEQLFLIPVEKPGQNRATQACEAESTYPKSLLARASQYQRLPVSAGHSHSMV